MKNKINTKKNHARLIKSFTKEQLAQGLLEAFEFMVDKGVLSKKKRIKIGQKND